MFVKPAPGGKIRWPRTLRFLSDHGEHVPADSYWLRNLAQGSVIEAEPPADAAEPDAAELASLEHEAPAPADAGDHSTDHAEDKS